jgi:hypothetical protein
MRITTAAFNTLPSTKDHFWQVVIFPTISVLKNIDAHDQYTAINFEWLFWSFTIMINDDKRRIFGS